MKRYIQELTGSFAPSAKVVDGTLILSLPNAIEPIVWRMPLGKVKSSAIEVRAKGKDFGLYLKTTSKDVNLIALYKEKIEATKALTEVTRAMERAHGHLISYEGSPRNPLPVPFAKAKKEQKTLFGWVLWTLKKLVFAIGLFALGYLAYMYIVLLPEFKSFNETALQQAPQTQLQASPAPAPALPDIPSGEAVSADDFLRGL